MELYLISLWISFEPSLILPYLFFHNRGSLALWKSCEHIYSLLAPQKARWLICHWEFGIILTFCKTVFYTCLFVVVQLLSPVQLFVTPWTAAHQASLLSPRVCSNSCPLGRWCHPPISFSVTPFSCLQSYPASGSFLMNCLFASGGQSIRASISVLPVSIQGSFPFRLTVWSPWSPRDSQESSPTPQFKSISSLVLNFLYGPTLIIIHDYWKNHIFDYMDLCWQTNISAF